MGSDTVLLPPFSKKGSTLDVEGQRAFMDLLTLQGKDTACVQNVRSHLSNDILSQARRTWCFIHTAAKYLKSPDVSLPWIWKRVTQNTDTSLIL
jgi:hypothetical protein